MRFNFGMPLWLAVAVWFAVVGAFANAPPVIAQGAADLEELVGPVALYPDDLLSIVLPASTVPLQIVEARRWIDKNKGNKDAKPKESWDDSVKALINYPDVIAMMDEDLDWTSALGEAVAADQTTVMDAVQSFRRKAEGAGNLKSDDKQVVVVEKEVVKIVQADPEVIYVPQYQPQTVVVYQTTPYYPVYYPTPYPVYYYPYPPGHAFAAGFFWGAATAYAFDWHRGHVYGDIDIDIDRNININNDRTNISNRATNIDRNRSKELVQGNKSAWKSRHSPSSVRSGRITPRTQTANRATGAAARDNTARRAQSSAVRQRPSAANTAGSNGRYGDGSRYQNATRHSNSAHSSPPSRDAFSGMSNRRVVHAQSNRGSRSRSGRGRR